MQPVRFDKIFYIWPTNPNPLVAHLLSKHQNACNCFSIFSSIFGADNFRPWARDVSFYKCSSNTTDDFSGKQSSVFGGFFAVKCLCPIPPKAAIDHWAAEVEFQCDCRANRGICLSFQEQKTIYCRSIEMLPFANIDCQLFTCCQQIRKLKV